MTFALAAVDDFAGSASAHLPGLLLGSAMAACPIPPSHAVRALQQTPVAPSASPPPPPSSDDLVLQSFEDFNEAEMPASPMLRPDDSPLGSPQAGRSLGTVLLPAWSADSSLSPSAGGGTIEQISHQHGQAALRPLALGCLLLQLPPPGTEDAIASLLKVPPAAVLSLVASRDALICCGGNLTLLGKYLGRVAPWVLVDSLAAERSAGRIAACSASSLVALAVRPRERALELQQERYSRQGLLLPP